MSYYDSARTESVTRDYFDTRLVFKQFWKEFVKRVICDFFHKFSATDHSFWKQLSLKSLNFNHSLLIKCILILMGVNSSTECPIHYRSLWEVFRPSPPRPILCSWSDKSAQISYTYKKCRHNNMQAYNRFAIQTIKSLFHVPHNKQKLSLFIREHKVLVNDVQCPSFRGTRVGRRRLPFGSLVKPETTPRWT